MPTSRSNKPTVLITIGDPAGIGPEVIVKALASHRISRLANFFVIGDNFVINKTKKKLGLNPGVELIDLANVPARGFCFGKSNPAFGKASLEYIDKALEFLMHEKADALVTGPVNKGSINSFLLKPNTLFHGHTEYIAKETGAKDYAMMFVGERLKATLVTRHIALKDVSRTLSIESIYMTIALTHECLKKFFGIQNPKIGVAGLNPHSGEDGLFGDEEKAYIIPAIRKANRSFKGISGPHPPDVVFYKAINKRFDAVISMYHDQGLIPFKLIYFKSGVNLSLGLPFIRTSPDHGTAFDIAGKGIADPTSMKEAIALACQLSRNLRPLQNPYNTQMGTDEKIQMGTDKSD